MPCRPGISSMSLGRCYAGHPLSHKLSAAAAHCLEGIELFYEDLVDYAHGSTNTPDLLAAASSIRKLCTSLGLDIICLQPFMHYEGLIDRKKHEQRIEEIKVWMQIAHVLHTDLVQIPSSFLPADECSGDTDLIVSDLRQVADMGLQQSPVIRFAYEALSWGTHVDTWEVCWDIVQKVGRENFGICLDSFNILGRIYADPRAVSGCNVGAEQEVKDSMDRLVQRIGPHREKIFFIQIVDAERLREPLLPGHAFYKAEQLARMSWSRNCRLFYGESERGAYLPVRDVAHVFFKEIGFEGWVSMELFNRAMERRDEEVVDELASRAAMSWERMVHDLQMETEESIASAKAEEKRDSGVEYHMPEAVARL